MVDRDFTEETKQNLLTMAESVAPKHGWIGQAADWVGDRALGLQQYLFGFDMSDPLNESDGYYHKVMDLNNTSKDQINKIWSKVGQTDSRYTTRFAALDADLTDLHEQLYNLANTINPDNGNFTVQSIDSQLKPQVEAYIKESKTLLKLADKGLSTDDLKGMSQDELNQWFAPFADSLAHSVPNVEVGATLVVPLGPDLSISIKNSGEAKDGGPLKFDVSATLKDNAVTLKRMASLDPKTGGIVFDKNGNPIDQDGEGKWTGGDIKPSKNGFKRSWSRTKDNKTETITIDGGKISGSNSISYSVSSDVNNATISSEIALNAEKHSDWKPLNPDSVKTSQPPFATLRRAWKKLPKPVQKAIEDSLKLAEKAIKKKFHIPAPKIPAHKKDKYELVD